ncbi:lipopolysaccharide biosynthesis protein [Lachnospiraceae bacterium C1.1]|nr:oligosaccharide flippase family protein [Lachnospiraceae bacterium C1.1]
MSSDNNGKKAVKSGFWYVISNVLIRAVGILTAPIYTRLLTTAETGYANNFNNYVSILSVIAGLCLIYSVGRAKLDFADHFDEYLSSIQSLSGAFGILVMAAVFIFCPAEGMLQFERTVVLILFAYLALYPSIDYMQYKYRFEYRYKENIAISVIITVSTVILTLIMLFAMPDNRGFAKILGTVIPGGLAALWCYINIIRKGKTFYNKEYWLYALRISLPMIPHGLAMLLLARIDTSMIANICNYSDVGLYTSGYTIGSLLMFVTNAVGNAWLPWFNERLYENDYKSIRDKNRYMMAAGCAITLVFIAAAPEAVKILYAPAYHEAMYVVPPVALGTLCQYFYTNYVNVELFYKKTSLIAVNSCIAAVADIGLNAYFIPRYGYIAAAYTTLAGYFILMILHFLSTRFILKIKLYSDFLYFILLLATSAAGIGCLMLYDHWIIRYAAGLIILGILAYWQNDVIMAMVFKIKNRKKS